MSKWFYEFCQTFRTVGELLVHTKNIQGGVH